MGLSVTGLKSGVLQGSIFGLHRKIETTIYYENLDYIAQTAGWVDWTLQNEQCNLLIIHHQDTCILYLFIKTICQSFPIILKKLFPDWLTSSVSLLRNWSVIFKKMVSIFRISDFLKTLYIKLHQRQWKKAGFFENAGKTNF